MDRSAAKKRGGFTIIEIVLTFGLSVILVALGISSYVSFARREALDAGAAALAAGLRDARAQTLASVGGSQYGVRVDEWGFTLFKGAAYATGTPGNEEFYWGGQIRASSSPSTYVFSRITGNSSSSGIIDVYIASEPDTKRTIWVRSTGLVFIN